MTDLWWPAERRSFLGYWPDPADDPAVTHGIHVQREPHHLAAVDVQTAVEAMRALVLHPTADTEIRLHQARELADVSGATDVAYDELDGASHYLQGHRVDANERMVEWLRSRL